MDKYMDNILKIAYSSLNNTVPELTDDIDWAETYKLLTRGKLTGVVFKTIANLPIEKQPSQELFNYWKSAVFSRGLRQVISNGELARVLTAATEKGLHPIPFKGILLSCLYPEPNMRFSCDADIYIDSSERATMEELLVSLGFSLNLSHYQEHVAVYQNLDPSHKLVIELHDCLWEDYEGKQMDILKQLDLTNPNSLIQTEACGIPVCTLGHTEHIIYQIFHAAKHFAFDALPLRYLLDLTVFINTYYDQIDAPRFWDAMQKLSYDKFSHSLFQICVTYLGMDKRILNPIYKDLPINEALIADIIDTGKELDEKIGHWASKEAIVPYFLRQNKIGTSDFERKKSRYFPSADELKDKFGYAKKYKFLLPIAWIHRFISAFIYVIQNKLRKRSTTTIFNNADYRLSLLQNLGMLEEK